MSAVDNSSLYPPPSGIHNRTDTLSRKTESEKEKESLAEADFFRHAIASDDLDLEVDEEGAAQKLADMMTDGCVKEEADVMISMIVSAISQSAEQDNLVLCMSPKTSYNDLKTVFGFPHGLVEDAYQASLASARFAGLKAFSICTFMFIIFRLVRIIQGTNLLAGAAVLQQLVVFFFIVAMILYLWYVTCRTGFKPIENYVYIRRMTMASFLIVAGLSASEINSVINHAMEHETPTRESIIFYGIYAGIIGYFIPVLTMTCLKADLAVGIAGVCITCIGWLGTDVEMEPISSLIAIVTVITCLTSLERSNRVSFVSQLNLIYFHGATATVKKRNIEKMRKSYQTAHHAHNVEQNEVDMEGDVRTDSKGRNGSKNPEAASCFLGHLTVWDSERREFTIGQQINGQEGSEVGAPPSESATISVLRLRDVGDIDEDHIMART